MYAFRCDMRRPSEVFEKGFKPWGTDEDLLRHVRGTSCFGELDGLGSAYVAVSADETAAQEYKLRNKMFFGASSYVYALRPDPRHAINVNAELAKQGHEAPNPVEREIAIKGGVLREDVRGVILEDRAIPNPNWKPEPE